MFRSDRILLVAYVLFVIAILAALCSVTCASDPSIVHVYSHDGRGVADQTGWVMYSEGGQTVIATNAHLWAHGRGTVSVASDLMPQTPATVAYCGNWQANEADDIMILVVNSPVTLTPIPIASAPVPVGVLVRSAGYPALSQTLQLRQGQVTAESSEGLNVSFLVKQGESGSPVVADGQLVGMIHSRNAGGKVESYAVPAVHIRRAVEQCANRSGPLRNLGRRILGLQPRPPAACQPGMPYSPQPPMQQPVFRGGAPQGDSCAGGACDLQPMPIPQDPIQIQQAPPAIPRTPMIAPQAPTIQPPSPEAIAGQLATDKRLLDAMANDGRFRGRDGTNGVDGRDGIDGVDGTHGRDGIDGVAPPIEYDRVRDQVLNDPTIGATIAGAVKDLAVEAPNTGWMVTISELAASMGLPWAVPAGVGLYSLFQFSKLFSRHRQKIHEYRTRFGGRQPDHDTEDAEGPNPFAPHQS